MNFRFFEKIFSNLIHLEIPKFDTAIFGNFFRDFLISRPNNNRLLFEMSNSTVTASVVFIDLATFAELEGFIYGGPNAITWFVA